MKHDGQRPGKSSDAAMPTRRSFIQAGLGVGGAFTVVFGLPQIARYAQRHTQDAASTEVDIPPFIPNAVVQIDRDGHVSLTISQVEMGQGTYTSMPMLIAEELEVELSTITVKHAPPGDTLFGNALIGEQVTGGSTSVRAFYDPLRKVGATVREMLIAAAAKGWNVDAASCHAENGTVVHSPTMRKVGYGELIQIAASIPPPADVKLKMPSEFKLIGKAAKRLDTPEKLNGSAVYGIDVKLSGLKVATVSACPVLGGRLASVDPKNALAVRGVRQIVQLDNAVAVVADHMAAAKKGLAALSIIWEAGPNEATGIADIVAQLAVASETPGAVAVQRGDVAAALDSAATRVDAVYQMPFLSHAPMEPINCTVHVQEDSCEVWVGTQVVSRAQAAAAEASGLPLAKVTVHNHLVGGGFGRRLDVDSIHQAVQFAKQVAGPVKFIWTREEDIQHDIFRPYYYDRLSAGLDQSGVPLAFHHKVTGSSIIARWEPFKFKNGIDNDAVEGGSGPYDFANVLVDYVRHEPPAGLTTGWWRGVGFTHNAFIVECFIDELATTAGQDPVSYRRNLLKKDTRALAVLDLVAEKSGWGTPLPSGSGRGISIFNGFGMYMAQVAEVSVSTNGAVKVKRVTCALDAGTIINPDTVNAQVQGGVIFGLTAALYGEITIKNGKVEQSNFDTYRMLRINEAPLIDVNIIQSNESPGGMGEPGTSGIAPAVVNAIFAATGKRLRKLPIDSSLLAQGA